MGASVSGIHLSGIHSARPAGNAVHDGSLYSCTTHGLLYKSGFDALSPMTTQDDLIVGGASGTRTRLAKGSDGQVLTVDPSTHHLVWATPTGGGSALTVKDEGSTLDTAVTSIDF